MTSEISYNKQNMEEKATKTCDECKSLFYNEISKMSSLCPECSHILYDKTNCEHEFKNARCSKCYWDGSTTPYVEEEKARLAREAANPEIAKQRSRKIFWVLLITTIAIFVAQQSYALLEKDDFVTKSIIFFIIAAPGIKMVSSRYPPIP